MDMTTFLVLVTICIIFWLGVRHYRKKQVQVPSLSANSDKEQTEPPRFLARLKTDIGPVVWAIREEDHFLRVYGEYGNEKILYRFSDAVHDLKDFKGDTINLGHWVLRDAIENTMTEGTEMFVVLKNGIKLPVCGTYRRVLEESGLA